MTEINVSKSLNQLNIDNEYYNENATEFITGTEFADISNLRNIFLGKIMGVRNYLTCRT